MQPGQTVEFKEPYPDEEGLTATIVWIDDPRMMIEYNIDLPIKPSQIVDIQDMQLVE